jgi:F0F1-type ATP synthase assembly protein I
MKDLLRASTLGIELAAAVFVGAGLGYWFDRCFNSKPWGIAIGLVIGAAAGFWNVYKYSQTNGNP